MLFGRKPTMVSPQDALPGRPERPFRIAPDHVVLGTPLEAPVAPGHEEIFFGMGCFWGSERIFWQIPGVDVTAVGYQGGYTPNPTYEESTTGRTGHTEVVRVVYDPAKVDARDPAQGVLGEPRPDDAEPAGQRHRHDVPLGGLHHERRAAGRRGGLAVALPAGAQGGRLRRDLDRDQARRRGRDVLVRRGLPPGLPAQEPRRLLQPRLLPGRVQPGSARPGRPHEGSAPRGLGRRRTFHDPQGIGHRKWHRSPVDHLVLVDLGDVEDLEDRRVRLVAGVTGQQPGHGQRRRPAP